MTDGSAGLKVAHRFDHVGLSVADLEAATAWYTVALGLTVESQFSIPDTDLRGVMLRHPDGYRVELLHRPSSTPGIAADHPNQAALTRGYGHMCFCVANVDTAFTQLVEVGAAVRVAPRPAPRPGARMAWVADPDGNLIELIDRAG
jgi:catechol 2,3-dioxygenase-like lactoylglutathione lyase family enzyme